jgi:ABC-type sugar transport system substrate-binding protein
MAEYGGAGAKKMLKMCKNPTRAVVLIHEPGNIGLEQQTQGFLDVMEAAGVPGDKLLTGQDATQGVEIIRSYFAKYPETDVIFTMGPKANLQAITYLKESGKAGKINVGFKDIDELTLSAISEGIALFTMTPQQYLMGYWSVMSMYLYKKYGFFLPFDVYTGPAFVDKTNLEEIRTLVEQSIW